MVCELNCHDCKIKNCGFRDFDAFANPGKSGPVEAVVHTQTRAQLHTRIDARSSSHRLAGSSSGGVGGGVPSAIQIDPALYTTDVLKAENAGKK